MSETTSKDDELLLKLVDVAADIYVSCRQNHSLTGVSHVYGRKILELFKQYGIQERIDEVSDVIERDLGLDYGALTESYLSNRKAELTALKDKTE